MQKQTQHISRKMTQNIFRAFDFALARDVPLNKYVVIRVHETTGASAATIFERIRHKYRDWLAYHSKQIGYVIPPMYVFSFETAGGSHVNWVLRIPPRFEREFLRKLPRWVTKVQGAVGPYDIDVSDVKASRGDGYKSLANYIAKGCDPAYLEHFHLTGLHSQHGPQGVFWGKRAGVSPSLNRSARDAAQYDARNRTFRFTREKTATPEGDKQKLRLSERHSNGRDI